MQFSLNVFSRIIYQVPLSSLSACLCIPVSACIHHFSPFLQLGWSLTYIWCSVSELSSENMRTCFQIVNAYIYLSATEFLQVRHKHTCCIQLTIAYIDGFRYIYVFFFVSFVSNRTMQNHCVDLSAIFWKTSRMRDRSKYSRYCYSIPVTHRIKLLFIHSLSFFIIHFSYSLLKFIHSVCLVCLCGLDHSRCSRRGIQCCILRHMNMSRHRQRCLLLYTGL